MSDVGTRRVFEDDRVIVWHLDLEPGEVEALHTHERDYVVRVLSGATLEVSGPNGELLYTASRDPGDAIGFRMEGETVVANLPGSKPIPATHSVRNIGQTTFRQVLIEFKQ